MERERSGFSEAALHEAARAQTGLEDFGDPAYLEGLRVLLDAYAREARFTPLGRRIAEGDLVRTLAARLRAQRLLADGSPAPAREIRRPVVVTGLVRTGSTALHHLLGCDPDVQVLEYWLACRPQPRPPRASWLEHPDFRAAQAELEQMYAADPSLKAIHFMSAGGPEECRHFLAQSFTDDSFEVNASVPSYTRWVEARDFEASYRHHRRLLELVGSTSPGKRWVLKYPVHMKHLAELLAVYPDACIVWTHRDPAQVMSSYVSLIASFRAIYERDIDRDAIAREQLEVWAAGAERAIRVRAQRDPARFYDLHFRDFSQDPLGCVRRIYERFGLALSEAGERALREHLAGNPRGRHGEHRHSIGESGVPREQVLERFGAYMRHFGIEPE
jgi:hypothetical protein